MPKMEEVSVRPDAFQLRSYRDGKILSRQPCVPYCEQRYAAPYLHIHRADYHRILVEEARRLGVEIILDSRVTGIDFDTPAVQIAGRDDFKADVILGADGLKSKCREALLGHADPPRLTGDLAYRIVVKADDMKKHPLLKQLAEKPQINYWMGPDAHAVCYLLKGGGVYNIVLCCPDNLPPSVPSATADLQEMRDFFKDWDPRLRALLSIVQESSKWRLENSEEMAHWCHPSGKFALMGDACHATLPYLASGAAMAVEDGAFLGSLFSRLTSVSQIPDILTIFETIRKPRATRVVKGSSHYRQIFHMHDGARQEERDRQLVENDEEPFEGYPNKWRDPVFQEWLWGYDVEREVEKAWAVYQKGQFPLTTGGFKANL